MLDRKMGPAKAKLNTEEIKYSINAHEDDPENNNE